MKLVIFYLVLCSMFLGCTHTPLKPYRAPPPKSEIGAKNWKPVHMVPAKYPTSALRNKIEGWAVVEFSIEVDGTNSDIKVIDAHPEDIFDQSTINSIKKFRYEYIGNGEPKRETGTKRINDFILQ